MNSDMPSAGSSGSRWPPRPSRFATAPNDVAVPYRSTARLSSAMAWAAPACTGMASFGAHRPKICVSAATSKSGTASTFIPPEMTIQDYPVSFEELEPHFDHFEKVCGVSGIAGNLRGADQTRGQSLRRTSQR